MGTGPSSQVALPSCREPQPAGPREEEEGDKVKPQTRPPNTGKEELKNDDFQGQRPLTFSMATLSVPDVTYLTTLDLFFDRPFCHLMSRTYLALMVPVLLWLGTFLLLLLNSSVVH